MRHHVKQKFYGQTNKNAKSDDLVQDYNLLWSFESFDNWGELYESPASIFHEVASRMKSYEQMTWNQIRSDHKRNHSVTVDSLVKEAQKRLITLKLDDIDQLWRFRFDGQERLWGIVKEKIFEVLWWDPHHKICPSQLKHT